MRVWHGSTTWKVPSLAAPRPALYVTDTAVRAQLYADAQASGRVSIELRYSPSSVVVELETAETVKWLTRPASHASLDKCETTIDSFSIIRVTARMTQYDHDHSVDAKSRRLVDILSETFRDLLHIIIIEEERHVSPTD